MKLVRRLALLTVRQDRAERFQGARLRSQARAALAGFDASRVQAADDLVATIEASPRTARRQLLSTPEGVDRLVAELVHAAIDEDRLDPIALADCDLDRDAQLAARYESAAGRELSRTLRDFHFAESLAPPEAEAEPPAAADLEPNPIPVAAAAAPEPPTDPDRNPLPDQEMPAALASFGAFLSGADLATESAPNPAPAAPNAACRPVPTAAFTPPRASHGR